MISGWLILDLCPWALSLPVHPWICPSGPWGGCRPWWPLQTLQRRCRQRWSAPRSASVRGYTSEHPAGCGTPWSWQTVGQTGPGISGVKWSVFTWLVLMIFFRSSLQSLMELILSWDAHRLWSKSCITVNGIFVPIWVTQRDSARFWQTSPFSTYPDELMDTIMFMYSLKEVEGSFMSKC